MHCMVLGALFTCRRDAFCCCFARGNSEILQAVENYLSEKGLSDSVELVGHLCLGKCKEGPNLRIDGTDYSAITPEEAIAHIAKALEE